MAEKTKVGFFDKIKKFFKDYKAEFKKIKWPTAQETTKNFGLVIAVVVVVGLAIFALDFGFNQVIQLLTKLVS